MMKLLHTSDWHLGRTLYGRKRYDEFEAFLDWLADRLEEEGVDVLLIAGDVFDNAAPGTRAQELYYRFLCRAAAAPDRHVVVIAGNHDSPSFLNAPKEILKFLNIHVVGAASGSPGDEVVPLSAPDGEPLLIVCAVPYLRDRDIRTAEAGETVEDKERKIVEGIRAHYHLVYEEARRVRSGLGKAVPIAATGHLFTAGGRTVEGDGVRELYIGTLLQVGADVFPPWIDYLALGHLHVPQTVGGSDVVRYSGSPLPIGFGEAEQEKSVVLVEFAGGAPAVRRIPVPRFQELKVLEGDWPDIAGGIAALRSAGSRAWLDIVYEGDEVAGDLTSRLDEAVAGSGLEILRVRNSRVTARALGASADGETLDDLDVTEVFRRCLDAHEVPEERRPALMAAYGEIVTALLERDSLAEGEGGP
jgi:exonuclease SbcD